MAPSIGVNLRVTGHCSQGGRKHMEDMFSVAYQQTEDEKDLEYAFFGIFDGHGGREAALFAKDHLMDYIVNQKGFWSDSDEEILRAIKDGFLQTHYAMWGDLETWPRTATGLPSTAGTTASIAFIRKGKIYIGHVGDSQIILGYQREGHEGWEGIPLTREHKPESKEEIERIEKSGGKVISKQGVPRVVWNRPRVGHKGPVRRSTLIDEIPFLAVARSLGDLWSYNSELDEFVVSPEPDVDVVTIEVGVHKCLIFGTDGLWNMMTPKLAATIVHNAEQHNEKHVLSVDSDTTNHQHWINPSKNLVDRAIGIWNATHLRADNTSAVTLMLDPPGPPRATVLRNRKEKSGVVQPTVGSHGNGCVAVFTRFPYRPAAPSPRPLEEPLVAPLEVVKTVQSNEVSSSGVYQPTDDEKPGFSPGKRQTFRKSHCDVGSSSAAVKSPAVSPQVLKVKALEACDSSAMKRRFSKRKVGSADEEDTSDAENKRCRVSWRDRYDDGGAEHPEPAEAKRTLRSDTAAASPIRTLRSRNLDVAQQEAAPKPKTPLPKKNRLHAALSSVGSSSVPMKRLRPQTSLVLRSRLRKRWSK